MTSLAASLLALLGVVLLVRSAAPLRLALRDQEHPRAPERLLGGLRRLIVGAALLVVAAGALTGESWLLLFGLVFLAEELVECSVHLGLARNAGPPGSVDA